MNNSILSPDMKGVMFVSGYRGTGKTFLAAHADFPKNIAFIDFDEGKAEGLHNQLGFGYYKAVEENEPLKRADMFYSEVDGLEQDKYIVAVIDNISHLEKALQAVVYRDAKKYAEIYGYTVSDIMKDNFGKARGIVNDLIGDGIAKPLHSKGVKLIIATSHVKDRYNSPGKKDIKGRDRWQELSILTLILMQGEHFPVPCATIQKESLGSITMLDNDYDAIMKGDIPSHYISRRLPARLPKANWQSIRWYLHNPADLDNPPDNEKLNSEESEPFSERLSKEQIAYQLGILEKEKKEEQETKVVELLIKQSQEKAIKEYISTNSLADLPGPVLVKELVKLVETGKLVYDGKINNNLVENWR